MKISILTLFPDMFRGPFDESMIKSARENGIVDISIVDIRDFATDRHRTADDYPFGGGEGMIMKAEPLFLAAESVLDEMAKDTVPVILISPQGRLFDQALARELSGRDEIILICGHYKGVDERVREHLATDEISIGNFVVTGGELGAIIIVDAVTRLLPGVLGDLTSAETDTFNDGLLEYGQYTRPREFRGYGVPEVLLGGNHRAIREWRRRDSLRKTRARRPDLLEKARLGEKDLRILAELETDENRN